MPSSSPKTAVTQREWQELADLDPLWAILADDSRQFGKWDIDEFFASGQREIDDLLKACNFTPAPGARALDFGCGVGRLSRALGVYFDEVYGVDISARMIELAQQYTPSCKFLLNQSDDLSLFERDFFDFVYSNIVLQHQETKDNAKAYIREFVRVVKPDGMIVFQIPSGMPFRRALQPRRRLYSILRALGFSSKTLYNRLRLNPMRTIWLSCKEVEATVSDAGGSLVRSYADDFNDESKTYVVTKKAGLARVAS